MLYILFFIVLFFLVIFLPMGRFDEKYGRTRWEWFWACLIVCLSNLVAWGTLAVFFARPDFCNNWMYCCAGSILFFVGFCIAHVFFPIWRDRKKH